MLPCEMRRYIAGFEGEARESRRFRRQTGLILLRIRQFEPRNALTAEKDIASGRALPPDPALLSRQTRIALRIRLETSEHLVGRDGDARREAVALGVDDGR